MLLDQLAERLSAFGADLGDVVKLHTTYAIAPDAWLPIAASRARRFSDSARAPAAVDVPLPRLAPAGATVRLDAIAMRGIDGRRLKRTALYAPNAARPPVPWSFPGAVKCGDKLFIGAQWPFDADGHVASPDDVETQTRQAMNTMGDLLALAGLSFRHVVKASTHYRGGPSPEDLHANMGVRNRYYARPGPASTGIPLPAFDARGQTLVLDAFAMTD
jgi:enamine deaminase RidA (YjgF/YER057c/UK114 family)